MHAQRECQDCAHFVPYEPENPLSLALAKCGRSVMLLNPFNGSASHRFCSQERETGDCGSEGVNFTQQTITKQTTYEPSNDHRQGDSSD